MLLGLSDNHCSKFETSEKTFSLSVEVQNLSTVRVNRKARTPWKKQRVSIIKRETEGPEFHSFLRYIPEFHFREWIHKIRISWNQECTMFIFNHHFEIMVCTKHHSTIYSHPRSKFAMRAFSCRKRICLSLSPKTLDLWSLVSGNKASIGEETLHVWDHQGLLGLPLAPGMLW